MPVYKVISKKGTKYLKSYEDNANRVKLTETQAGGLSVYNTKKCKGKKSFITTNEIIDIKKT